MWSLIAFGFCLSGSTLVVMSLVVPTGETDRAAALIVLGTGLILLRLNDIYHTPRGKR